MSRHIRVLAGAFLVAACSGTDVPDTTAPSTTAPAPATTAEATTSTTPAPATTPSSAADTTAAETTAVETTIHPGTPLGFEDPECLARFDEFLLAVEPLVADLDLDDASSILESAFLDAGFEDAVIDCPEIFTIVELEPAVVLEYVQSVAPGAVRFFEVLFSVTADGETGAPAAGVLDPPALGDAGTDVTHYELAYTIDPRDPSATELVADVTFESSDAEADFDFVAWPDEEFTLDGEPVTRTDPENVVVPVGAGEHVLHVEAAGAPPAVGSDAFGGLGLSFDEAAGVVFGFSQPDGARGFIPGNDHPTDRATFRVTLDVPPGFTGVSNGLLVEETEDAAGRRVIWESAGEYATYHLILGVGEFVMSESDGPGGIPIRTYAPPELEQDALDTFATTGDILVDLAAEFGDFPYPAYGHIVAPGYGFAFEAPTLVLFGSLNLDPLFGPRIVAHEAAHMWFGDLVTVARWQDIWLNEGFASWAEVLWAETDPGPETREDILDEFEEIVAVAAEPYPLDAPTSAALFGVNSYMRGALVVEQLRQTLGAETFRASIQAYLERFGNDAVTTDDLQDALEEATGMSLDDFFARYVDPAEVPMYATSGTDTLCAVNEPAEGLTVSVLLADGTTADVELTAQGTPLGGTLDEVDPGRTTFVVDGTSSGCPT